VIFWLANGFYSDGRLVRLQRFVWEFYSPMHVIGPFNLFHLVVLASSCTLVMIRGEQGMYDA